MNRLLVLLPIAISACSTPTPDASDKVRVKLPADALAALREAPRLSLLSLYPGTREEDEEVWAERDYANGPQLAGYPVLGEASIRGEMRGLALQALFDGIDENDGTVAECFEPRHGIRVVHRGRTFSFVICFECLQIQIHESDGPGGAALVSESPRAVFNAILRARGVPLPDA